MFTHHAFTVHTLGLGTRLQTSQAHLDHAFPSVPLEFSKGVNKTFEILFFFLAETLLNLFLSFGASHSRPELATVCLVYIFTISQMNSKTFPTVLFLSFLRGRDILTSI